MVCQHLGKQQDETVTMLCFILSYLPINCSRGKLWGPWLPVLEIAHLQIAIISIYYLKEYWGTYKTSCNILHQTRIKKTQMFILVSHTTWIKLRAWIQRLKALFINKWALNKSSTKNSSNLKGTFTQVAILCISILALSFTILKNNWVTTSKNHKENNTSTNNMRRKLS